MTPGTLDTISYFLFIHTTLFVDLISSVYLFKVPDTRNHPKAGKLPKSTNISIIAHEYCCRPLMATFCINAVTWSCDIIVYQRVVNYVKIWYVSSWKPGRSSSLAQTRVRLWVTKTQSEGGRSSNHGASSHLFGIVPLSDSPWSIARRMDREESERPSRSIDRWFCFADCGCVPEFYDEGENHRNHSRGNTGKMEWICRSRMSSSKFKTVACICKQSTKNLFLDRLWQESTTKLICESEVQPVERATSKTWKVVLSWAAMWASYTRAQITCWTLAKYSLVEPLQMLLQLYFDFSAKLRRVKCEFSIRPGQTQEKFCLFRANQRRIQRTKSHRRPRNRSDLEVAQRFVFYLAKGNTCAFICGFLRLRSRVQRILTRFTGHQITHKDLSTQLSGVTLNAYNLVTFVLRFLW